MDFNDYKIHELIDMSNQKIDYRKFLSDSTHTGGIPLMLIGGIKIFSSMPLGAILCTIGGGICLKRGMEMRDSFQKRKFAQEQLYEIVTLLKKHGIKTNRLRLQKAEMCSVYDIYNSKNRIVLKEKSMVVFKDRLGELKALKQIRMKLLNRSLSYEEMASLYETHIFQENGLCETQILEDPEQIKTLFYQLERN